MEGGAFGIYFEYTVVVVGVVVCFVVGVGLFGCG